MDEQQQQRINEAAEQLSSALVESFRAVSARGEAAQKQGAQLTQDFFNRVLNNLRAQAEDTQEMTQHLADQQQRQAEAAQTLTRESVDAYMDFMDSMFSYWQGGIETAERVAEPSPLSSTASTAESTATTSQPSEAELPLENYDKLSANEVTDRIEKLDAQDIERLRDYEAKNKNRRTVLERMDARISAASEA